MTATTWVDRDATVFTIRPIHPADEAAMVAFHAGLTESTVYGRYFEVLGLDARTAHERLMRVCDDHDDLEVALVAEHERPDGERAIVAVGRLSIEPDRHGGECAILVSDAWQRHGLGSELLRRLVGIGRDRGVEHLWADMLPTNAGMRRTARDAGFTVTETFGSPIVRAEIRLRD